MKDISRFFRNNFFYFLFHFADKPGHFEVELPIVIDKEFDKPYQMLHLGGELRQPQIWFDPLALVLNPVPLGVDMNGEVTIMAKHYQM